MAELTLDDLDRAVWMTGWLQGFAENRRHAFDDHERAMLSMAAGLMAKVDDRPDRSPVPSITCPSCGMRSYNPNDIRERYCGNCHRFEADR